MNPFFTGALQTEQHPIKKAKPPIQAEYFAVLTYIVELAVRAFEQPTEPTTKPHLSSSAIKRIAKSFSDSSQNPSEFMRARLRLYQTSVFAEVAAPDTTAEELDTYLSNFAKPWRRHYLYALLCDVGLILLEKPFVIFGADILKKRLSSGRREAVDRLVSLLYNREPLDDSVACVSYLIEQYRDNTAFSAKKEKRWIVTANMSAGKSTLINALIGKAVARTSQEVCTGNICYIFNKPFEDGRTHLSTSCVNLDATHNDLRTYDWDEHIAVATHFGSLSSRSERLCLLDTPGVDAALHAEHSERTYEALRNADYDAVLYVVSPTNLGTDAEKKHLRWVAQNMNNRKILFVVNKLDNFLSGADSIEESLANFKKDLLEIGFASPKICPISAYFAYLIKMKLAGVPLSEDEEDEYALYARKFSRPTFDLSKYYDGVRCLASDSDEIRLSKRAGLYGLEKIIYGGTL